MNEEKRVKFVFFWGHRDTKTHITKSCLSQWYHAPFLYNGHRFDTAEHFMMAEKARLFGDTEKIRQIVSAENPGKAKALGREIKDFDQKIWNQNKVDIVIRGNLEKFSQNPKLGEFLLNTGTRILAEASPVDTIWGTGLAAEDPAIDDPAAWPGQNLLGFALMEVRHMLQRRNFFA